MRLIDADALLEAMRKEDVLKVYECIQLVNNAPTVQREGWVSVPIEPTEEMLKACDIDMSARNTVYSFHDHIREYYKAMIQAAPTETE